MILPTFLWCAPLAEQNCFLIKLKNLEAVFTDTIISEVNHTSLLLLSTDEMQCFALGHMTSISTAGTNDKYDIYCSQGSNYEEFCFLVCGTV